MVAAAGNDAREANDPTFYPASDANVIGVGAAGWNPEDGEWYAAEFSNTVAVDEWAPGVAVSSDVGGEMWQRSGTWFGAPLFAVCLATGSCEGPSQ